MSKFNQIATSGLTAPIHTTSTPGLTHEGGTGFETDAKSSLFRLAAVNMVGEKKFYSSAEQSDSYFRKLIHEVTNQDPGWVARFVPYLRQEMFMRSAAVIVAVEYVVAGGPNGRAVINSACSRVDELTEVLAYWAKHYDNRDKVYPMKAVRLPAAIKRGLADACTRLLNEYNSMKYDQASAAIRLGDIIELVHPKPRDAAQSALFTYLLTKRHQSNTDAKFNLNLLPKIRAHRELGFVKVENRRSIIEAFNADEVLAQAGFTHEQLSGWLQGPMDGRAWSVMIPSMGAMALVKNLRNFDEASITDEAYMHVAAQLTDEKVIGQSMMFPYRFWSAYKEVPSTRWANPLEHALEISCHRIPELTGRTLVLVDYSASMAATVSEKSKIECWEVGALFGVATFVRSQHADLVAFGTDSYQIPLSNGADFLGGMRVAAEIFDINGGHTFWTRTQPADDSKYPGAAQIEHGTNTMQAILKHYQPGVHDRIVIFSDGQAHRGNVEAVRQIKVPVYSFDLGGYQRMHLPAGEKNSYILGGFSDASFTMMKVLEDGSHSGWPF